MFCLTAVYAVLPRMLDWQFYFYDNLDHSFTLHSAFSNVSVNRGVLAFRRGALRCIALQYVYVAYCWKCGLNTLFDQSVD